jgi:hypothetical protein
MRICPSINQSCRNQQMRQPRNRTYIWFVPSPPYTKFCRLQNEGMERSRCLTDVDIAVPGWQFLGIRHTVTMAALMDTDTTIKNHYVRSAVVFVACLGASFLIPYFAVFLNSSLLFFAPQILFPYRDYVDAIKEPVFSHHVALLLTFLQWVLVTASFAWLARRMSLRRTMLAGHTDDCGRRLRNVCGVRSVWGFIGT